MDQNQYSFGGMNIRPDQYQQLQQLGMMQQLGLMDGRQLNSALADTLMAPQQVDPMQQITQAFNGGGQQQAQGYGYSNEGFNEQEGVREMTPEMEAFGFKQYDPSMRELAIDVPDGSTGTPQEQGVMSKALNAYFGDSPLALFNPLAQGAKAIEYGVSGAMGKDTLKNSLQGDYGSLPGAIYNSYNRFFNK